MLGTRQDKFIMIYVHGDNLVKLSVMGNRALSIVLKMEKMNYYKHEDLL